MGWVDNLESDLAKSNQAGPSGINNSQPGPSHFVTPVEEINQQIDIEQQQKEETKPETEYDLDNNAQKEISPYEIFAEKVTIAGLQEAYNAKLKSDRIMFRVALILAFMMIIWQTIKIAGQYSQPDTMFVDLELINYQTPFPNVSACFKVVFDEDLLNRIASELSPKIQKQRQKFHVNQAMAHGYVRRMLSMDVQATDVSSRLYFLTRTSYDAMTEIARKEGKNLMLETIRPSCPKILSNCAFNRRSFNCCEYATFLTLWEHSCFQISLGHLADDDKNITRDPLQIKDTGLTFDISTNWTFGYYDQDQSATDGYHIVIDSIPAPSLVPVHVPANMDVLIQLRAPTQITERTGCRLNKMPKMKYFSYDDANGFHCKAEFITDKIYEFFGCHFPTLNWFPVNETCSFVQNFILSVGTSNSGQDELIAVARQNLSISDTMIKNKTKFLDPFEFVRFLYSPDSPCLPLCTRWAYPALSSSYGAIQYKNTLEEQKQLANRSWSRIRVILPQSSSTHSEELKAASYLAMCDIGGMMGVYAGFSMITFAQIGAYGFLIGWAKWKKRRNAKAQPSQEEEKKTKSRILQMEKGVNTILQTRVVPLFENSVTVTEL